MGYIAGREHRLVVTGEGEGRRSGQVGRVKREGTGVGSRKKCSIISQRDGQSKKGMSYLGFCDFMQRAVDAPSYGHRNVANPILTRLRAFQLRRQSRRQELDVQHHLLARPGRLAVRSEGRPQQGLVDQEVEGKG